jgi:hypothetical protein
MSRLIQRTIARREVGPIGDPSLEGGKKFTRLGDASLCFETDYFLHGSAPQYLVRYKLKDNSPVWSCTCPDFVYRRGPTSTMCKHCEGAALLIRAPTDFVNKHIRLIGQNIYDLIAATPLGQPLPLFGQLIRVRVKYPNSRPGFVSFTMNRWRCYTCGGRNGSRYLRGKQCKHIACYVYALNNPFYGRFCTPLDSRRFMSLRNIQFRNGTAHWQRFM